MAARAFEGYALAMVSEGQGSQTELGVNYDDYVDGTYGVATTADHTQPGAIDLSKLIMILH